MSVVSVYALFADSGEAERIGRAVIEERLAACINILAPCRSIYRWQRRTETAEEIPAIIKTSAGKADALVERIAELHSYETPCIAVWPIARIPDDYSEWVEASVGDAG